MTCIYFVGFSLIVDLLSTLTFDSGITVEAKNQLSLPECGSPQLTLAMRKPQVIIFAFILLVPHSHWIIRCWQRPCCHGDRVTGSGGGWDGQGHRKLWFNHSDKCIVHVGNLKGEKNAECLIVEVINRSMNYLEEGAFMYHKDKTQSSLPFCEDASLSCPTCSITPPTCFHTDSATTYTCSNYTCKWRCCTLIGLVEATEQADGRHPTIHVLLGLSHQVPGPLLGLQVKDEGPLQLLLGEGQASVHLQDKAKRQDDGPTVGGM